ncbi:hypothetical protein CERZMDRAFT_105671 [Cercospora zeae-maydis SCOH1-5]|uniref:FAD-binding domain-containing protein n=1 Tax=Cercospora zeae-maydis SCOH1-5 TaxID=717836 RepID=A0A6A6FJ06_9PEZI|nr:hypothetical protein CERZMDRAFT_105671 [Cercospora zeae-maydis SCOH1-5]
MPQSLRGWSFLGTSTINIGLSKMDMAATRELISAVSKLLLLQAINISLEKCKLVGTKQIATRGLLSPFVVLCSRFHVPVIGEVARAEIQETVTGNAMEVCEIDLYTSLYGGGPPPESGFHLDLPTSFGHACAIEFLLILPHVPLEVLFEKLSVIIFSGQAAKNPISQALDESSPLGIICVAASVHDPADLAIGMKIQRVVERLGLRIHDPGDIDMAGYLDSVTIIGAGLGSTYSPQPQPQGCALGLALSARNIPVTIYESRPEVSGVIPSGVILTPNGLRILDRLAVYERIKDRCYLTTHRIYLNDQDEITKKVPLGGPEVNGYWGHRIWRALLLDEMRLMLQERNVSIHYDSKFTSIVSEDSTTGLVTFLINDSVSWPSPDFPRNATIQGKPGAIFWISEDPPTNPSASLMIGLQTRHAQEYTRSELEALKTDRPLLLSFYKQSYDEHSPLAQKIIDAIEQHQETLYSWPMMKLPRMEKWYSPTTGRIILVGDAAHALPPSSGQGVNQALEDVYSLVLILEEATTNTSTGNNKADTEQTLEALAFWQKTRQDRLDAIWDWTENTNNVNRLPEADREKLIREGKIRAGQGDDTAWLFRYDYDDVVKHWKENRREAAETKKKEQVV